MGTFAEHRKVVVYLFNRYPVLHKNLPLAPDDVKFLLEKAEEISSRRIARRFYFETLLNAARLRATSAPDARYYSLNGRPLDVVSWGQKKNAQYLLDRRKKKS